jgi:hypothetical protein
MRVYISGQIAGLEEQVARERFESAETLLSDIGLIPVNPLSNGLHFTARWEEHIVRGIELLMGCDAIMLLGNWEESKGARIERHIAEEMGLKVLHEQTINDESLVKRIRLAIAEVTGLKHQQYSNPRRFREGYYCRLIFTHHCLVKNSLTADEVASLLNRQNQDVRRYRRMYYQEYDFNKAFRNWADRVKDRLSRKHLMIKENA